LLIQLQLYLRSSFGDGRMAWIISSQPGFRSIASGTGSEVSLVSLHGIY
jgi:hypothetical protein